MDEHVLRCCSVRSFIVLALLLAAGLCVSTASYAQQIGPATDYVTWTVAPAARTVAPQDTFVIRFEARIDEGWKMYALDSPPPTRGVRVQLDSLPGGLGQRGALRQSVPTAGYDPNFQKDVRYFEREALLRAAFDVPPDAAPGSYSVTGVIQFMICNDRLCLPPTNVPFKVPFRIVAATLGAREEENAAVVAGAARRGAGVEVPGTDAPAEPERVVGPAAANDLSTARSGGLWRFLLLAAGAGLAALLTPCVFPMIPLTVSYFTRHAHSRPQAVQMAATYGLAIVLTFTGLGVLMAVLLGAAGAQTIAANPWINLFIGLVFVVFALSLLGLFELRLPSGLLNYFNEQSDTRPGYAGVLFMGFTLTLVSFSCTAPFVGGLLAATTQGEWGYPILGMAAFSTTFALPFVLFALFPRGLEALPKSGSWMNAVKVTLGFVELAAAIKFLSNADLVWGWGVISRPLAIAFAAVIFFLAGLYLLGKLRLAHEPKGAPVGVGRLLCAIGFFGVSLYVLPGLFGAPLNALDAYLPPRQGTDVSLLSAMPSATVTASDDFAWHDAPDAAFAEAAQVSKPVFIDFTGYTCTNCREMEANVFPRPEVAHRLQQSFVLLRLYTDDLTRGVALQRYQLQLTGTVALPTYAVVSPHGEQLIDRLSGIISADELTAFLDRGLAVFAAQELARASADEEQVMRGVGWSD